MPEFSYTAMANDGAIQNGELTASDREEAARIIEKQGLVIVSLEDAQKRDNGSSGWFSLPGRNLSQGDLTILISDLAALAQSRLRIDEAIRLMLQELELGNARKLLTDLLKRLSGGQSLSAAMQANLHVFDQLEIEMIRFAEESGDVGATLHQIAQDRELREKVRNQISGSLRYPVFLLFGSMIIMVFFLIYVIPQFETVLAASQAEGSTLSFVFSLSRALSENSDLIMICALIALVGGWIAAKNTRLQARFYQAVLKLPFIGEIAQAYRSSRICLLISQTQRAGIELPVALSVIGPAVDGTGETAISQEAVTGLRQGKRLSVVLEENGKLQPLALRMLKIGEESSQVEAMALRAATLYEARAQRLLNRLIAIVGPATLILISAVIGGMIVLLMTALLSINDLIAL